MLIPERAREWVTVVLSKTFFKFVTEKRSFYMFWMINSSQCWCLLKISCSTDVDKLFDFVYYAEAAIKRRSKNTIQHLYNYVLQNKHTVLQIYDVLVMAELLRKPVGFYHQVPFYYLHLICWMERTACI